jgi:hypothetical protein
VRRPFLFAPFWIVPLLVAGALPDTTSRAFQIAGLTALLAALWETGSRIAGWLVPGFGRLSAAVAGFTAAVGVSTAVAQALGTIGALRPPAFLLAVAAVYLGSLAIPPREAAAEPYDPAAEGPPSSRRRFSPEGIGAALAIAALAAIALFTLATLRELRLAPPGWDNFDDLSYHLPAIAVWHRFGDLRMMKLSYGDPSTPYYPIVGELASWAMLAPFGDSDVAARWSQLPFAIVSAVAAAAVARRLGLSRRSAAVAAALYLSIRHVLPVLALSAGNDHTTAFFTLAALDGALATARRPSRGHAAYTGLAVGLLAGTKYLALFYAATLVLLLAAALAILREPRRELPEPRSWRRILALVGIAVGVSVVAGGYAYLRNAWAAGNPFFPAPVTLFGKTILPGMPLTGLGDRLQLPEARIDIGAFLLHQPKLFGTLGAFLLVPAALLAPLVALLMAWAARRKAEERGAGPRRLLESALVLALPAIFFLEFLAFMHDHRDPRYFLAGIALAGVAFVWLLERAGSSVATAGRALVALWVTHEMLRRLFPEVALEALAMALLLGAAALAVDLAPRLRRRTPRPPAAAVLKIAALAALGAATFPLGRTVEAYQKHKLRGEPAARTLEEWFHPGGARIAYVGWNQPYFFFGSRLQNSVEVVPHTRDASAAFYDWNLDPALPYDRHRPKAWLDLLDELEIDFVVVVASDSEDPERRWIAGRPERFEKVYDDLKIALWRVNRGRAAIPQSPGVARSHR